MNCLCTAGFSRSDYFVSTEIRFARGRRADMDGLIRRFNMQGTLVGVGVHCHGLDLKALRCLDNATSNFTSVRN
jgi:hypothetical protein